MSSFLHCGKNTAKCIQYGSQKSSSKQQMLFVFSCISPEPLCR